MFILFCQRSAWSFLRKSAKELQNLDQINQRRKTFETA
jgi:hypothetical protein